MEQLYLKPSSLVKQEFAKTDSPNYSSYYNDPSFLFNNASPGEIFNFVQQLEVSLRWDIRYRGQTPKISLFRDHMFYVTEDKSIVFTKDDIQEIKKEIKIDNANLSIPQILEYSIKMYLEFDHNGNASTSMFNFYETEEKKIIEDFDYLERKGIRKFSENHFAISGYNLIAHEIAVSDTVPNTLNTVDPSNGKSNNKILTILPKKITKDPKQTEHLNFLQKTIATPNKQTNNNDLSGVIHNHEFLVTQLVKELSYSYQGKIFIKYKDDIEIGDTITLLDHTSATYGIFEVDAFEHSLDERGLMTILLVKAKVNTIDPVLDYYYLKMSYDMINDFQNKVLINNNTEVTLNYKLKNIFGCYIKTLLQTPKYLNHHYLESNLSAYEVFDSDNTDLYNFNTHSVQMPIRFFPLFKKGKMIFPKSLKYAFFENDNEEIMSSLSLLMFQIAQSLRIGFYKGLNWFYSLTLFVGDFMLSSMTQGISDILKPLFGVSEKKAFKNIVTDLYDTTQMNEDNLFDIAESYNPYNGIYNVGNFDLTIGFWNIQAQQISNMFPENAKYSSKDIAEHLEIKRKTIHKVISQAFNIALMVETYDSFNTETENIDKNSDLSNYTMDDFIEDIKPQNSKQFQKFHLMRNVLSNKVSNEFGLLHSDGENQILSNEEILLNDGRKAIETTLDINWLNIKSINKVKIIWFHNIYKESKIENQNIYEERKANVIRLMQKYEKEISRKMAVIIMADFNLNIFNYGETPLESSSAYTNATLELEKNSSFVSMNKKATTVNKYGEVVGNPYDNVLASSNISDFIKVARFVYPLDEIEDRKIVSDHIPICIGFKKNNGR